MSAPDNTGLRKLLESQRQQIAMALPKWMTPEHCIRVAVTTFMRTTALHECSPISILGCVIQAGELGLELSGPLGQAYMVPYRNKHTGGKEAQFQIGYRGLMDLAYRSGRVTTFCAHCVHQNDVFEFQYGTQPKLRHIPSLANRGEIIAVYAVLCMAGGGSDFEVMSKSDIEAHRTRYSKDTRQDSAWNTAWEEMAKKTVIRKLAKRAPVSIDLRKAAAMDEYNEAGINQNLGVGLAIAEEPKRIEQQTKADDVLSRLGGGRKADPVPVPVNGSPETQQAEAEHGTDLEREDLIGWIDQRISEAQSQADLAEVGKSLTQHKDWLGQAHETLLAAYHAKHKGFELRAPERKRQTATF